MNKETAQWLLSGAHAFQKDPKLREWENVSKENFIFLLNLIFKTEDLNEAISLLEKIVAEELTAPSIPSNLNSLIEDWEKSREKKEKIRKEAAGKVSAFVERQKKLVQKPIVPLAQAVKEETTKKEILKTNGEVLAENEASFTKKIEICLKRQNKYLEQDPNLSQTLASEVKEMIIAEILANPAKEIPSLWPQIDQKLQKRGIALGPKRGEKLLKEISAVSQPEISRIKETGEKPLPQEMLESFSQKTEGVAFPLIYTILQPKIAAAFLEKSAYTPVVKFLEIASDSFSSEWKEMIQKGIFVENIEHTIQTLLEAGLPKSHPTVQKLENRRQRLWETQKNEKGKDRLVVKVLKRYHRFAELMGKPLYDSKTKIFLERKTIWSKGGYSLKLREGLNKIGLSLRLYQRVYFGPGKTVFSPSLSTKIIRFLTLGKFDSLGGIKNWASHKVSHKIIVSLGKTAAGKAVKESFKKAAFWVAKKLGIEAGIMAAGTAAAAPTGGTSLLIAAAIEIGIKIVKIIWNRFFKPIATAFARLIKEPEKALGVITAGAIIVIFAPPLAFFGYGLMGFGLLGFASNLGGIISGFATGVTSFFSSFASISISSTAIITLLLGTLGTTSFLTFLVVMTTAGAFVLPEAPEMKIEEPYPTPPVIPPPPNLSFRWPVDTPYRCSSNFGYRPNPQTGDCCEFHEGIDIPANCGEPVYAIADGIVVFAGNAGGYGKAIVIKHAENLYSFYAHLEKIFVSKGQNVKKGDLIGNVGSSGNSTGCHLHFGFSDCGEVPECFNNSNHTPDPCNYLNCPVGCGYQNQQQGCQNLPLCSK